MQNIAFEALYLPFILPNLAALLIGQSLEAGLSLSQSTVLAAGRRTLLTFKQVFCFPVYHGH